jgi:hypothetical protein
VPSSRWRSPDEQTPFQAASRYAAETDYDDWKQNLTIIALDLRDAVGETLHGRATPSGLSVALPGIERLCAFVKAQFQRLDGIIHNACQTVRRPPAYYLHLLPLEMQPIHVRFSFY